MVREAQAGSVDLRPVSQTAWRSQIGQVQGVTRSTINITFGGAGG